MAAITTYATLARVKRRLRIADADTTQDTLIGDLLDEATADIASYCDRNFAEDNAITEDLDCRELREQARDRPAGNSYMLAAPFQPAARSCLVLRPPLLRLDSIYVDASRTFATALTVNTDYKIGNAEAGEIVKFSGGFPFGPKVIRVTYLGGYTLPTNTAAAAASQALPEDIQSACVALVCHKFWHPTGQLLKSEAIDSQGKQDFYDGVIPAPVAAKLWPWKRMTEAGA